MYENQRFLALTTAYVKIKAANYIRETALQKMLRDGTSPDDFNFLEDIGLEEPRYRDKESQLAFLDVGYMPCRDCLRTKQFRKVQPCPIDCSFHVAILGKAWFMMDGSDNYDVWHAQRLEREEYRRNRFKAAHNIEIGL